MTGLRVVARDEGPWVVAGQTCELVLPRLILRHDLLAASVDASGREQPSRRVVAAALGVCCPTIGRKLGLRYRGDVLDYGGEVADALLARGGTWSEIVRAGNAALQLCADAVATDDQIAAARGNSGVPTAGGVGSSTESPAGGGLQTRTG